MQTEEDGVPVSFKKKNDKGQQSNDNITVSHDKTDTKKGEKSDGEDPKPRIVLTFRSEKSGAKTSNMKIVPNDEKHDEFSPRRSSRTRGKWEWSDETDASISPRKEKNSSQSVSENDETSDSSPAASKRTRRQSKDSSDNALAHTIAKKEKSLPDTSGPTQRLSRRIKPTAKILANEELRIGLESQNNARLGIQTEKTEEGVRTRRSARPTQPEAEASTSTATNKKDIKISEIVNEDEFAEEDSSLESKQDPSTVMKLKHLCELGLKAINTDCLDEDADTEDMEVDEDVDDDDEEEEDEEEEDEDDDDDLEDDEIEDDPEEVISKLLEADEDSSEDFLCTVGSSRGKRRPRRSTRLCSSYGGPEGDQPSPVPDDDQKEPHRRSSRRSAANYDIDREYCLPRKRNRSRRRAEQPEAEQEDDCRRSRRLESRSAKGEEVHSEQEDNNSEAAGGDEGAEAACPEDESAILATCFCEAPSNVHAAPSELTEPVFCQAVETVDGVRVGCSHAAGRGGGGALAPLLRAGPRAPFLLACRLHHNMMRKHMCCPACGLFCTQGIFYQCSVGHLFHLECGLPYNDVKLKPGCPHCGVRSSRWQPANTDCSQVQLQMRCSNKRVFLPDQREQCTQAYLTFSSLKPSAADQSLIPDDLFPLPGVDLAVLRQAVDAADAADAAVEDVEDAAQKLCDAIMAMEPVEQLLPKITSRAAVRLPLPTRNGGGSVHCASARGHAAALHLLRAAGGDLDAPDHAARTPLILSVQALLDKPENQSNNKSKKSIDSDPKRDTNSKEVLETKDEDAKVKVESEDEQDSATEKKEEDDSGKASDEDLMKVIRYLVAAGCNVDIQGAEGMTALHIAAQHGSADVCSVLLEAGGASVDARDHGGWTPLVWAAENRHTDCVRLLLQAGADAGTCDAEGNGAVHWCALAGDQRALKLLLDHAPRAAHALNAHGDTPLHVAARQGHYACVIILLARGARTDVENAAGELAADVCAGACQRAISLNTQMARIADAQPCRLLSSDISMGREPFPVACVNELDSAPLPADFNYVTRHVLPAPLAIDDTLPTMQGCDCKDGDCSTGCSCCALSVRRWWSRGRLPPTFPHHDPPMLFECNDTCGCDKRKCVNMVVSRMVSRGSVGAACAVFRAGGRGWGLRAVGGVPRGAPVAAYVGELLAVAAADTRADDRYMFALDLKPDLLEQCSDKTLLCVDACRFGGAARFVNHSCRANLAPVRVFPFARDLRLPTVALVATRDVRAGEELTFDYGDKFWSVKSKFMKCECGTPECRYPEKSADSDS